MFWKQINPGCKCSEWDSYQKVTDIKPSRPEQAEGGNGEAGWVEKEGNEWPKPPKQGGEL